ncbi:hypothetical protein GCM10020219_103510 [Nonomuraea dietziae]
MFGELIERYVLISLQEQGGQGNPLLERRHGHRDPIAHHLKIAQHTEPRPHAGTMPYFPRKNTRFAVWAIAMKVPMRHVILALHLVTA